MEGLGEGWMMFRTTKEGLMLSIDGAEFLDMFCLPGKPAGHPPFISALTSARISAAEQGSARPL